MYNQERNFQGRGMGQGCRFRAPRGCGGGRPRDGRGQGNGFGHGGARQGAGRPSNGFCQRVQLRLTDEQKEFWLNSPELQEEIRDLIDRKMKEANS